jgi:hypothetical protein
MSPTNYKIHTTTDRKGPGVAQWLRRCTTTRTVPGSIPGGVTVFFGDIFPSDRTMALGSTQPLWKWVPGTFLGVQVAGAWGWHHHHHMLHVMKYGSLNFIEPSGPNQACYWTALPLPLPFTTDLKLAFLFENIFMIWFYINTMRSHTVCTHWMYRTVANIGLKMVL